MLNYKQDSLVYVICSVKLQTKRSSLLYVKCNDKLQTVFSCQIHMICGQPGTLLVKLDFDNPQPTDFLFPQVHLTIFFHIPYIFFHT